MARVRGRGNKLRAVWLRAWRKVRPGPEARKGATWAVAITVVWAAIIGAVNLKTGFGLSADLLFAFLIAVLGIALIAVIFALLLTIVRKLPRMLSGFFVGAFVLVPRTLPFGVRADIAATASTNSSPR